MTDTTEARGIGDNRPPPDPLSTYEGLVANANRWTAERPEIVDDEMAGVAQEFVRQLRLCRDDLEAASKAERQPHDLAVAAIRIRYRTPLELIGIAMTRMGQKLTPWLSREQQRLDAEAAERARAARQAAIDAEAARKAAAQSDTVEAELAVRHAEKAAAQAEKAAAKPAERAAVKGDMAKRAMTMRVVHFAIVIDEKEAYRSFSKAVSVREAVKIAALEEATKLASALARESKGDPARCPAGFEFRKRETPV